jgi:hypothetical protein
MHVLTPPLPTQVLGSLCDKLRFSPEAALELHKSLYKTKMSQLVGDQGEETKGGVVGAWAALLVNRMAAPVSYISCKEGALK